jgi:ADP-ribose pyrophosphatase YjhB (NUDIX family)
MLCIAIYSILKIYALSSIDLSIKLPIIEIMQHRNPIPTVDIIIEISGGIILIKRKNPPFGWAIPGGFIDYGESAEHAAKREAKEETGLDIENLKQFHTYSAPDRDPRHHTISVVFNARTSGTPKADDDAADIGIFIKSWKTILIKSIKT